MARAETIGRLHAVPGVAPPVKTDNLSNLEIDVSPPPRERQRGRFVISRRGEPQAAYRLDPAEVMSIMSAEIGPDRSEAFAQMAAHERAERLFRQYAPRVRQF